MVKTGNEMHDMLRLLVALLPEPLDVRAAYVAGQT